MNPYLGHRSQMSRVELHTLVGGKGNGMRLLEVSNGKGLEFVLSADRCLDISRLSFRGINMSYFSPCGYVAPAFYDNKENGFLQSFTAGFLTTCGLNAVGECCRDEGETLPLHGTIANTPAEELQWKVTDDEVLIHATIPDEQIFAHKLVLHRTVRCSLKENSFSIKDEIINEGDIEYPAMLLYHMNMGYPLLSEQAELYLPTQAVIPRNEHAKEDIQNWNQIHAPQAGYEEECFFHELKEGIAAIYNPEIGFGLQISFDREQLPCFTQWKMLCVRDYVMGLEPGNCLPTGRDKMRENGQLKVLAPGEKVTYQVTVKILEDEQQWRRLKQDTETTIID